jgi:ATP-binding cassette subfamily B protein
VEEGNPQEGQAQNGAEGGTGPTAAETLTPAELRIRAGIAVARYFGVDLDIGSYRGQADEPYPSPASLAQWLDESALSAKAIKLKWSSLFRVREAEPVILLLRDGTAAILVGADRGRAIVWIKAPTARDLEPPVAVDRMRLEAAWAGDSVLVRRPVGAAEGEAPFTLGWIAGKIFQEKPILVRVFWSSFLLALLAVAPAMLVIVLIERVLEYNSVSTLTFLALIFGAIMLIDTTLNWVQRELLSVLAARTDTLINMHTFTRLLSLPLEFFERSQAGETLGRMGQIYKVREFVAGKVLSTALDFTVLLVLVPILFYIEPQLASITVAIGGLAGLVIIVFLPSVGRLIALTISAEHRKSAVMTETLHGIRTVKSLALENNQRNIWDERVADASGWRLAADRMSNWPQTIIDPMQTLMTRGVIILGAYLAIVNSSGVNRGGLMGYMLLSTRVAAPILGMARLLQDYHETRTAIGQVAAVLNNPTETRALTEGARPKFDGRVQFQDITFTYPLGSRPALNRVNFDVPPGTMLGLVGRSGSGKSTITRLLQGINREYTGAVRIDGIELRNINLFHLRRSFGVVLQDNFLFRGSIKDNIISGRPGLTLEDAVRAARLAGAEEFIERMPQGYETWIEEGSSNISGGQRQRLAIARALITNPRIMILDEATSALDPESEALVNANLERIGKGRTMVIVSHRLSSLVNCDLIMVMEQGEAIDIAPHHVLLERCAIYRTLWNQQNRHIAGARVAGAADPTAMIEGA